ncbi:MAG: transposase [Gemmatimonadota bacterium]
MRHRIYVHCVWTTRNRRRLIDATIADKLCPLIRNVAEQEKAAVLGIGMVQTHVICWSDCIPPQQFPDSCNGSKAAARCWSPDNWDFRNPRRSDGARGIRWRA